MHKSFPSAIPFSLCACALILVLTAMTPSEGSQQSLQPGTEALLRQTYNTSRFVYVEFDSLTLVYEHKNSRLFPVPEDLPVRISEVNSGGSELKIKYRHPQLGEGEIKADIGGMSGAQARAAVALIVGLQGPGRRR